MTLAYAVWILWLAAATPAPAVAASPTPASVRPEPVSSPSPSPTPAATTEYQAGVGDILEVVVAGNEDISRTVTIQTNGALTLPLLGEIAVAGLTPREIGRKLTTLLARDYLVNPQVEVKVKEYQSQSVLVLGEINYRGRKVLRGRTRLFDLLIECGGFTPNASGDVTITRKDGNPAGATETIKLRFSSASFTQQDQINIEFILRNGDVILAGGKQFVTVEGEVGRPGRFPIEEGLTVSHALVLAGGLTRFGSNTVKLRRESAEAGKPEIIKVDLKGIRNGKQNDPLIQPNDRITVPRRFF
jgi:polysaccharide export outer membrane protein